MLSRGNENITKVERKKRKKKKKKKKRRGKNLAGFAWRLLFFLMHSNTIF